MWPSKWSLQIDGRNNQIRRNLWWKKRDELENTKMNKINSPSESLCVNNWISCLAQNSCISGGTTQHALKLICAMAGFMRHDAYRSASVSVSKSAMPSWRIRLLSAYDSNVRHSSFRSVTAVSPLPQVKTPSFGNDEANAVPPFWEPFVVPFSALLWLCAGW